MTGFSREVRRKPKKPCSVEGCERPLSCRKMCATHYANWRYHADPAELGRWKDPEVRFAKATKWGEPSAHRPDLGPCLIFTGADNGNGYGQFRHNDKNGYAHRYAWERTHGAIPDSLTVDHLCRVRRCVNVDHMELTDRLDNYLRGVATRTHCPNGHEYTPENLYTLPGRPGVRFCKICKERTSRKGAERRTNAYRGLPNRRIKYDQQQVRELISEIRAGQMTINQAARDIGCSGKYLGRRVWEETKRDVLDRDGGCLVCGTSNGVLDAHHRIARGVGGATRPEISFGMANLVTLCRQHHSEVEANPAWARTKGLRVDRGTNPETIAVACKFKWIRLTMDGAVHDVPAESVANG